MRATINQGLENEISWTIDDPITPDLVESIENAGDSKDIKWDTSQFTVAIDLLLTKYNPTEIEEMIYDEDPDIIDVCALALTNPLSETPNSNLKKMIRLYLPVMLVLLRKQ
jgi:hypothetical protein